MQHVEEYLDIKEKLVNHKNFYTKILIFCVILSLEFYKQNCHKIKRRQENFDSLTFNKL